MKWLDALVKIFPNLKDVSNNTIHFSLINVTNVTEDQRKIIYIGDKSENERQKLFNDVLPKSLSEGVDILPIDFDDKARDYSKKINIRTNQEIISYFRDKIPLGDLPILKASLYLRSVLKNRGETDSLKQDIVLHWGPRGRNISNLCTGMYFENWFKPLYEQMCQFSDFTVDKFRKVYNEIVENLPFSLFVTRKMKEGEIAAQIKQKIKMVEQYGLETLNIHGIGREKIKRIRKTLDNLPEIDKFEITIKERSETIVVILKKK